MDSSSNPSLLCSAEDDADPSQQRRYGERTIFEPNFKLSFIFDTLKLHRVIFCFEALINIHQLIKD